MIGMLHWFQQLDWQEWMLLGIWIVAIVIFICDIIFDKYDGLYS